MSILTVIFQPFKVLGSRTLNKITDFLTAHSADDGVRNVDTGSIYEHWASAVKFQGLKSVQQAIDERVGPSRFDTFVATILLGLDDEGDVKYPIFETNASSGVQAAINALSIKYGARLGFKDGSYLFQDKVVLDSFTELMGDSQETLFVGSPSGEFVQSGGYIEATDGIFRGIHFSGDGRLVDVGYGGTISFEDCYFDCMEAPAITVSDHTRTLFRDCEFVWHGDTRTQRGLIENNPPSGDLAPNVYLTFSDCTFRSQASQATYIRYDGYDSLPNPTIDNWTGVMSQVSKIKVIRCDFEQFFQYGVGWTTALSAPLIRVWKAESRDDAEEFVVLTEFLWNRFRVSGEYSVWNEASMPMFFGNSFDMPLDPNVSFQDMILFGYESTIPPGGFAGEQVFMIDMTIADAIISAGNNYSLGAGLAQPWKYHIIGLERFYDVFPLLYTSLPEYYPELASGYKTRIT